MSLFKQRSSDNEPLAARMRPRTLAEYIGQDHIVGPGRLLRRAIEADQLSSLIFFGPPGTGKTTLARVIANRTEAQFLSMNAVLSGVKNIREAIKKAEERRDYYNLRSILFIDEVHRFNKAQQDALLPHVENGTVILIGATTENPYFEVNKALVSRSRVFQLKPLTEDNIRDIILQALADPVRGYGRQDVRIQANALAHLVNVANGDARAALNAVELAVETTQPDASGIQHITLEVAEESIQRRAVLYDKEGDAHFDTISAFIKSLRGSDPDAALYWLARMVYAGEDPRYIFRRLLILAGEDVGLADPHAISVVEANAATFDRVGMPEGRFHLAAATLYLANCPKSNSTLGFFDALAAVKNEREGEVPNSLKDGNRDAKSFGHGAGYLYPHAYRDHWVAQQYLPDALQGRVFYQPSDQGYEAQIRERVARRREEQLAAMLEGDAQSSRETLTFSPTDKGVERWMERTLSSTGASLGALRDRLFAILEPERHHLVLDIHAGSGLLTWEALRRVPEGGVWSLVSTESQQETLEGQAQALPQLIRPEVRCVSLHALDTSLRFDRVVGRQIFTRSASPEETASALRERLADGGLAAVSETLPHLRQRLYGLLQPAWLPGDLHHRLTEAEETFYADEDREPEDAWRAALEAAGLEVVCERLALPAELRIGAELIARWFDEERAQSYASQLAAHVSPEDIQQIRRCFVARIEGRVVPWANTVAVITARTSAAV